MRTLLLLPLLLLAAPVLAQEDETGETAVETKADDASIEARVRELLSQDREAREAAIRALERMDPEKVCEVLMRVVKEKGISSGEVLFVTPRVKDARVLVLDPMTGSSEVIRGSADGYDYTLESIGDGRYTLRAKRIGEDGRTLEEFVRDGTLKELQEKYPFLRKTLAIQTFDGSLRVRDKFTMDRAKAAMVTFSPGAGCCPAGLTVRTPPEELSFHLELPEGAGLIVERVDPGSRAEKLGLRRFDILLRLDGELIDSPRQLEALDRSRGELEIIRRAELKKIDLVD